MAFKLINLLSSYIYKYNSYSFNNFVRGKCGELLIDKINTPEKVTKRPIIIEITGLFGTP